MAADTGDEVSAFIASLDDWRGGTLTRIRALIHEAEPAVTEDVKWKKPSSPAGVPVWSHDGIICTGEPYTNKVKFTFPHGAALADPSEIFNAGFGGNTRRAIDVHEGDQIDADAFIALVRAAVAHNSAS